jgi:hypothetical protein
MIRLSATLKGVITGIAMIFTSFIIHGVKGNFDNSLQYITYSLYVLGIVWALLSFERQPANSRTFRGYFSQGFRCFIVVVLLMVLFTAGFLKMHPELTLQMGEQYRTDLLKQGNKTGQEIEKMVASAKRNFLPAMMMAAVFSYLLIGSMITAITSAVLMQRRRSDV